MIVAEHYSVGTHALKRAPGSVHHARKSAATIANTKNAVRSAGILAIHVKRNVLGDANIMSAQSHAASFVIALVAMNHVQSLFRRVVILVLVSVGNHVQRSAESVIRTKSQKSFSVPKTNQTLDSLNWRTVVTCSKWK